MKIRVGFGYDVHQLKEGKPFFLGGIQLEKAKKGAVGHSDADVLIHAICDALLGAAALNDIGYHFPDTDPEYKNIDSKILLKKTLDILAKKGYSIVNIDSTICLEKPKIKEFIPEMTTVLAEILKTNKENISVKATTTEKLGFIGKEEGIAAHAVVLIQKLV